MGSDIDPGPASARDPRLTLELVARRARQAVQANLVAIVAEVAGGMHVLGGVDGTGANELRGLVLGPANGSRLWRRLLADRRPFVVDDVATDARLREIAPELLIGRLMMIPLENGDQSMGALVLAGVPDRDPFTLLDMEIATAFARSAAEALELIRSQEIGRRMALAEDRDRTARRLHDDVMQRLFAVGLRLERAHAAVRGQPAALMLEAVAELNETISEIRTTVFSLQATGESGPTLRDDLVDLAIQAVDTLGFDVHLVLEGTLDRAIPTLRKPLRTTVDEALATIARDGSATRVDVLVRADEAHLALEVRDNGTAPPRGAPAAGAVGGTVDVHASPDHAGSTLTWRMPIPARPDPAAS